MLKFFFSLLLFVVFLLKPLKGFAFETSDPSVSLLQNRISNNFSKRYCSAIQNGFSKDEAMKSAIVKTENIISFSYNPQKKMDRERWLGKSNFIASSKWLWMVVWIRRSLWLDEAGTQRN